MQAASGRGPALLPAGHGSRGGRSYSEVDLVEAGAGRSLGRRRLSRQFFQFLLLFLISEVCGTCYDHGYQDLGNQRCLR